VRGDRNSDRIRDGERMDVRGEGSPGRVETMPLEAGDGVSADGTRSSRHL